MAKGTIVERLDAQIAALAVEKQRIKDQAVADLDTITAKIQTLKDAKAAITPAVESAYVALAALGLQVTWKE